MAISGKTGLVDGACNDIVSWTVDLETDLLDVSSFCSEGYKEYIEGLKGGTGTLESYARYSGTSSIVLTNSAVGSVSISGDVIWNSESIENAVSGIQTFTHGFTFTGAITIA